MRAQIGKELCYQWVGAFVTPLKTSSDSLGALRKGEQGEEGGIQERVPGKRRQGNHSKGRESRGHRRTMEF